MEKKKTYIILGIITLIIVVFGVTFAWVTWRSADNTNINLTLNGLDIKSTDIDITGNNIMPVLDKENGIVEEFTVKQKGNNGDAPICADFTLTLTLLPDGLKDPSFKYDIYNGSTLVGRGSFENYNQGDVITIASGQSITTTESKYKIYVYLDGNMDNPITVTKQTFLFHLKITANQQANACEPSVILCDADEVTPNAPVIAEGMIPIKWNGSNWVKADSTNSNNDWYDYVNKKWANAVMVNASSRDNYMNADEGTTITEDDVLAYYVWIPRYSYKLFNVNSESMDPIEICMQFEPSTETKSTGSNNGEYLTHPAFTFGTTELDGIWVGKFETGYGTNTSGYPTANTLIDNPTIKPNVTSLRNQKVSIQFSQSQYFGTSNYLTTTGVSQVDAHMMKNTEWGAVAYLKQSKYGLGTTDIGNNAYYSSNFKAGCGSQSAGSTSYGSTCNTYNTDLGKSASTTGNITGIYDMSGGSSEYVMGVMKTSAGTALAYSNSGFTTSTLPFNSKYVDQYEYGTTSSDQTAYNRRILGDATSETRGWYSDSLDFPYEAVPWFVRGGLAFRSGAGVFCAHMYFGDAYIDFSFRSVLALVA